ncbi:M48 family metallopeptidase [Gilvimarinus sp. SDUM040013]|uniref:M48 family metallopeptidase n=1 Tax=Gilvimarinus gilvus TaxID=3058038 RepID=A0ABU4S1P8_9GAMM|nr:M48 family metallopeptidase [Gilvimarinus sp. SDUM040013]MDO3386077.1 M48 family metallopeptidase [Gilvimarinus sp. SDUM040013]MDX6850382.1 M48 family metallopeptidase [Gilvimarinus sp. SDUM040013]
MSIHGKWYSGSSAQPTEALLSVSDDGQLRVTAQSDGRVLAQELAAVAAISSRLGNTARFIKFDSGASFETRDNEQVDAIQKQWQGGRKGLLHALESHMGLVVASAVIVAALMWGGAIWGVPAASKAIAYKLPQDSLDTVAEETLAILDRIHFAPSELSDVRKAELHKHFAPVLAEYPQLPLTVIFRHGGEIGANAFALPNGTMIFTDEMVELAHSDDELVAVLAHEIGHVALRHSMRAAIANTILGFVYVTLVGDGTALSDLMIGLPVALTTFSYSRSHETEADEFSAAYLDRSNIDRTRFIDLMHRLGETAACTRLIEDSKEYDLESLNDDERLEVCEALASDHSDDSASMWLGYLSTHPDLEERLEAFRAQQ